MKHEETIAKSMAVLCATFNREAEDILIESYSLALAELTPQEISKATAIALRSSKFFPKPAELIELARTNGISYEAQAAIAFDQLDSALSAKSSEGLPPITKALIHQLGGWQVLSEIPLEQFGTWKRKDFIAAYIALAKENPERLAAIAGPQSELSIAFAETLKRIPTREETAAIEHTNRQKLLEATK